MEIMKEKYRGVIMGTAIGDTLGMPVETWKPEQIKRYTKLAFGIEGIREPIKPMDLYKTLLKEDGSYLKSDEFGRLRFWSEEKEKGEWTDDTILTLAVAEAILNTKGLSLEATAKSHIKEFEERLQPDGTVRGGFGRTTTEAIKELRKGTVFWKGAVNPGPGNGPAMKMAPVGMYMEATKAYNRGLAFAEEIGMMTHLDPRSIVSGVIQAHAVYSLLIDIPKQEFIKECTLVSAKYERPLLGSEVKTDEGNLTELFDYISENPHDSDEEAYQTYGGGFEVWTSMPHAYFMFNKYGWDEPLEGLLKLVNYGGDSDTTGAIYGALAGAKHGLSWIPKDWIEVLDQKTRLIKAADGIFNLKK